jgi:TolB protein
MGTAFADGSARWAPDKDQLAIASYTAARGWRLYVVGPSGGGLRYLARGSQPSWSPDGSKIAFSLRTAKGNDDVYVIGADGSGLTRLTSDPSADNRPSWSPDGSTIAFFSARDGQGGIYVMNPDGTDQRFVGSFPFTAPAVVWRITGG